MKKICFLLSCFIVFSLAGIAAGSPVFNLLIAPGTLTENSVTILWDKQYEKNSPLYEISLNGSLAGTTTKTNYSFSNLSAGTEYMLRIRLKQAGNKFRGKFNTIKFTTASPGKMYNILDYGARPDSSYSNTRAIQAAIDACDFIRGHGISIGSEMSGGVSDVLVQDCKAGALLHGVQIKATKDRGGYVKNVTVTNCRLLKITLFSAVNYNNDGEAAPQLPTFANFIFKNIDLADASTKEPVININGFKDSAHRLRDVQFINVTLPENAKVMINDAERVKFTNVKTVKGLKPVYEVKGSEFIKY
jgi:polygalacturonase